MTGSSGMGAHEPEEKPFPGNYVVVPGSAGREKEIMDYMKQIADKGMWFPGKNDCFTKVEEVLKHFDLGVEIPFHRTGPIENADPGHTDNTSVREMVEDCGK